MAGTKLHVVSCFALFALLVAPFAWQQTQVQRTELPADRITALAWNASRLANPARHVIQIFVRSDLFDASASSAAASAVATLSAASPQIDFVFASLLITQQQQETFATLALQPLDDALLDLLPADNDVFSLVLLCRPHHTKDASTITVGKHRHAWSNACSLSDDASLATALAQLTQHHLFPSEDEANLGFAPAKSNRARVAVKYRLEFSLLQEGGDAQWGWDFDKLHKRYLTPVLEKLSSIAQLTVEHQTVHYARLAKEIHSDVSAGVHFIHADDLKHFKSTNDFLTTSVLADREQVLHFMAALPSQDHAPLVIKSNELNREATAFEIPGWGVVVILDPRELTQSPLAQAKELQRVMGRFISELRTLLGLPSFVKRQRAAQHQHTGLSFLPSPQHGVAQWELDVVVRSRLRRHVKSSIETLQSILQLVTDIPELSVLDRVAQRITHAVDLVERVLTAADGDVTQDEAALLEIARLAVEEADAAYYDHTMIRQLYFPQEQLLGVFAPLLAPLLLPFFVGWLREVKQLRTKRKAQATVTASMRQ